MRKSTLYVVLIICLSFMLATGCRRKEPVITTEPMVLSVFTSFYPLYDFTEKIGGDRVQVVNLVPAGVEPHDWEPGPQALAALAKADLFVVNGLGMEPWFDKLSDALDNTIVVIASEGITPLYGLPHEDEDEEDEHEEDDDSNVPDPHVWLDPWLALHQASMIKDALCKIDPVNTDYYTDNLDTFRQQVEALDSLFIEKLQSVTRREFVVTHLSFAYLANRYQLNQMAISGLSSHAEPSPAQMRELIDYAHEHDIRYIFQEPLASSRIASTLAEDINAQLLTLNPLEGLSAEERAAGDDYFSIMRKNLEQLAVALGE